MSKQLSGTEIVGKLRQADVLLAQGNNVPAVCREIGVSQQTYYRWRKLVCQCGRFERRRWIADRGF